eukprot:CAMPEP_0204605276 /NCGR_PEP_ID=MMETSP0661-20131031/58380_1 /ASSEMBLY_ACC=CAM_ASM_000606 /TAXON_ID=109239 /ORGANISM="Alexandrium margalefi, Strain AMGDE01CS-322" /LENGTH=79 /DNA_ID=CAMNT_0051616501 /DNA_START=107 /DNA_END=343 /DNA_ORIENTATION=+
MNAGRWTASTGGERQCVLAAPTVFEAARQHGQAVLVMIAGRWTASTGRQAAMRTRGAHRLRGGAAARPGGAGQPAHARA